MLKEDKNEKRLWMVLPLAAAMPLPLPAGMVSSAPPLESRAIYLAFTSARTPGKISGLLDAAAVKAQKLTDFAQECSDSNGLPECTRLVRILQDPKPEDAESAKRERQRQPAAKRNSATFRAANRLQFRHVRYLSRRPTSIFSMSPPKNYSLTSVISTDNEPALSSDGNNCLHQHPQPIRMQYNTDIWVGPPIIPQGRALTQINHQSGPATAAPACLPIASGSLRTQNDIKARFTPPIIFAIAPSTEVKAKV